jgi:hypothetical protein
VVASVLEPARVLLPALLAAVGPVGGSEVSSSNWFV